MKAIPLRNREKQIVAHALVDDGDYERLMQWGWYRSHWGYAVRTTTRCGKHTVLFMHREVMGVTGADRDEAGRRIEVDHRDRNKLDCRRTNLRLTTALGNGQNRGLRRDNKSGERGVRWDAARGRWAAEAGSPPHRFRRRFREYEDAVRAVRAWRAEHMPFSADAAEAAAS